MRQAWTPSASANPTLQRGFAGVQVLVAVAAVVTLVAVDPTADNSPLPSCLWRKLTGLQCPGCGVTRMFHEFLHGRLWSGLAFNPLGLVIVPSCVYLLCSRLTLAATGSNLRVPGMTARAAWAIVGIVLVVAVVRNLH